MLIRFSGKKVIQHIVLNFILVLILIMSTSATVLASDAEALSEIRSLIQNHYVDQVSDDVLKAPTVDEMLKRLGDPHTVYFSPEQYQEFEGSIDMRFTGIGIHIEMVPEGVKVVSVISGSPAEEVGLSPGDVILLADGQALSGLSSDEAVNLLRGLEGSTVLLSVKQGAETRDMKVTRRAISEPTVTGEVLGGNIGYLDVDSFGSDTPAEFTTAVNQLKEQRVDRWIVDLRDNGGGYLSSAITLVGYFVGPDVAVCIKDRTGTLYPYEAKDSSLGLSQTVMVLINENSASASEILAAAVKDHRKATLVGATTYGKGTIQSVFPLMNGGVLKMTVNHFYSPFEHEINGVGVSPNVNVQQADSLKVAELMLSDETVGLTKARTTDYWEAWEELHSVDTQETTEAYSLYYPSHRKVSELAEVPLDKKFTVHFAGEVDWQSVDNTSIELINSNTGERTLTTFEPLGQSEVRVIPQGALRPNTTYWLVIHPLIQDVHGRALQEGGVAVAHTIEG